MNVEMRNKFNIKKNVFNEMKIKGKKAFRENFFHLTLKMLCNQTDVLS